MIRAQRTAHAWMFRVLAVLLFVLLLLAAWRRSVQRSTDTTQTSADAASRTAP